MHPKRTRDRESKWSQRCPEDGRQELQAEARSEHGRKAQSKLPTSSLPTSAQLLLQAAKATEILTTSNFLQEPHTGGEKIPQAFPMKSFPQALPTPRASWLGPALLPPPPSWVCSIHPD